ncbi:flagellar biosynthesis protein FlhF [Roseiconus lacunae]|uniref:flagellar biosynthesis protein FlhF n=1 Tax=Roseiconus lacunae TaxID=2605694 RepID=UPI001E502D00|nr:flagellar biosynthesis protein FlhF [Roseiconus lacunae]MCD0458508.1 flagellar biosynthesis protein FlhF [Roseiconus lacunae]
MESKTFRAANLQAALEEIREELGPNASVLSTRHCRDGWRGWLGQSYVEVTASRDGVAHDGLSIAQDPDSELDLGTQHRVSQFQPTIGPRAGQGSPIQSSSLEEVQRQIDSRQVNAPSASVTGPRLSLTAPTDSGRVSLPASGTERSSTIHYRTEWDPLSEYRFKLISLGVEPNIVDRWINATGGFVSGLGGSGMTSWLDQLKQTVSREICINGPIAVESGDRRIVALIGPTGVGKTTTVAKLAAGFRMNHQHRVGLLTIDTFRIAAIQQLQAYAQIMDLPMQVVESVEHMPAAIDRLGDVDLILIDTAGRSPSGDVHIEDLARILNVAQPDETHLVISATSTASVVRSVLDGFSIAQPTAAVLTKLDETPYTAGVLSAIARSIDGPGIPVSYITNGQHVPQDIAAATAETLVERLLPSPIQWTQMEAA